MAYKIIPGFKGGVADSLYDPIENQTFQTAKDLDVFTYKNLLTPYSIFSTVTLPTVSGGTSVKVNNVYYGSDGNYYFIGTATISGSNNLVLWSTPSNGAVLGANPTYTVVITAVSPSPSSQLEEFKDYLYFGYGTTLKKLTTTATAVAFTVTIATPAVFTSTAHGFEAGDAVMFSTTGALPTGLSANIWYYVISAGLTANDFEVSTTVGGSAVNTSGTQSGTHTIIKSTKTVSSALTSLGPIRANEGLGKVFFGNGNAIGSYTGSTLSLTALTLNSNESIIGHEPYGKFQVVGINDDNNSKKSRFLIWDGASTTLDDIIYTGDTGLRNFRIVGNEIRAVFGDTTGFRQYAFQIGAKPEPIITIPLTVTTGDTTIDAMDSNKDLTIFGLGGYAYSTDSLIWAYGSGNAKTKDFLTQFRTVAAGTITAVGFSAIKDFNGQIVIIWDDAVNGTPVIEATKISTTLSANGIYESNAFPLNKGLPGKIKRITMNHKPIPASTGFTVQIKYYGHYPWGNTVPAEDSFADLTTPEGSASSTGKTQSTDNATMTEITGEFKTARYAQIKIKFDEISGATAPTILFPIIIEVED